LDSIPTSFGFNTQNQFFGLPSSFTRPSGPVGPFLADPRVYFDWQTNRWFVSILQIDTDPKTGAFQPHSSALIAVSSGVSPFSGFNIYEIDLTNDGTNGTPTHPHCPCFGDQPLIGADAHAFWVSTNEFPVFQAGFNGAQVYAMDKAAMAAGGPANTQHVLQGGPLAEGISYTVQPATIPPGGVYATLNNGTQYFLSTLEFFGGLDNRIAIWAATNTASISTTPAITIQNEIVGNTIVYGQPPAAQQPNIPVAKICSPDLFMLVGCGLLNGSLLGQTFTVHAPLVDSNDDRMQQVMFANGTLWSTVTTVGKKGAIGFSIVGPGMFPGTGYAKVSLGTGVTEVKLTSRGAFPDDGFTGYPVFDDRGGRWGDYSAAVVDATGDIWVANEMIPCQEFLGPGKGCFRAVLANWGTLVAKITP
jgi:hypothetical protein